MTPYYDRGGITLHCGDNVEVLRTFADGCIDLTVTSPPYDNLRTYGGHGWGWDEFTALSPELFRVTKEGGVVVWIVNDATVDGSETGTSFRQALHFKECGFRLHDTMIYQKAAVGACGSNKAYWQEFEFMFVLAKGEPNSINLIADRKASTAGTKRWLSPKNERNGTRKNRPITIEKNGIRCNIWRFQVGWLSGSSTSHSAPFPEALARDHILSWSNEGDTVLDPFCGSGTTPKMAKLMGRKCVGIEINEDYMGIQVQRLRQEVLF